MEPKTVRVLVNLFLHPGCITDINLARFLNGRKVSLTEISPHIITAFPTQLAKFSNRKKKNKITQSDLLECFALDHADSVEENQKSLFFEPSYALAHVLTIGKIKNLKNFEGRNLAEVLVKVCDREITFKNVLVPSYLSVKKDQTVFHHFGVVVAKADNKALKNLARKLQLEQNKKEFLNKVSKQVLGIDVDYTKSSFFKFDMTGRIIEESEKDIDFYKIWQEDDLEKVKIPKTEKIMFSS